MKKGGERRSRLAYRGYRTWCRGRPLSPTRSCPGREVREYVVTSASLATLEIEAYFEKFYFLCDLKYRGACFPAADQGLKRSKGRQGQFHVLHGFRETCC